MFIKDVRNLTVVNDGEDFNAIGDLEIDRAATPSS
jgi:hypothetical protein